VRKDSVLLELANGSSSIRLTLTGSNQGVPCCGSVVVLAEGKPCFRYTSQKHLEVVANDNLLYFFCDYRDNTRNSASAILRGLLTRTKWALSTRDDYKNLVDAISSLVNELIAAFPAEQVVRKRTELCEADAVKLATEEEVAIVLKEAVGKDDEQMKGASDKVATATHVNTASFSGDGNQVLQMGQNMGFMTNTWGRRDS
jgi:SAM-dependent MidA family methyltransferase